MGANVYFRFYLVEDDEVCIPEAYIKVIFNFGSQNYNEIVKK